MPEQAPEDRARNFEEVPYGYTEETAMLEASRCLKCKKPKCIAGCPVNVDIPGFIALVQEGKFIEAAWKLNHEGKMIVPIIDDAHLMHIDCLRKLRLLFEDFPKGHNLVLFAQMQLMNKLHLLVNEDIKSRITYSAKVPRLNPDDMRAFIFGQKGNHPGNIR